jgi:hypothetical protein
MVANKTNHHVFPFNWMKMYLVVNVSFLHWMLKFYAFLLDENCSTILDVHLCLCWLAS